MRFTSPEYAVLLAIAIALYYRKSSVSWQLCVLLLASAVFYGYGHPWLLFLLLATSSITACAGYAVACSPKIFSKRLFSTLGVVANLVLLAFFKYAGLLAGAFLSDTGSPAEFLIRLPLPLGISYYTFRGISLMLDAYRKDIDAQETVAAPQNPFFSFYVRTVFFFIFFPQLIAGPIAKAKDFMAQIEPKYFKDIQWYQVARLLIVGYFLKCYCADNLQMITVGLNHPWFIDQGAVHAWTLLLAYSVQLFADFAGYSLIAIGSAAMFGYRLPQNFHFPYIADSFADFWRRWHMSLSSWLRDYVYVPLGGSRTTAARTRVNIFLVMVLCGMWHGSRLTYLLWGACHGLLLVAERPLLKSGRLQSVPRAVRRSAVFLCISLLWLFFKLPHVSQILEFLKEFATWPADIGQNLLIAVPVLYFSLPVLAYHAMYVRQRPLRPWLEDGLLGVMLYMSFINAGFVRGFIYGRF